MQMRRAENRVLRSPEACYLTSQLGLADPCFLISPRRYVWPMKISRCRYRGPLGGDGEGSAVPVPSGFLKPLGSLKQSCPYLKPAPLWSPSPLLYPIDARPPRSASGCPSLEDLVCTPCPHCSQGSCPYCHPLGLVPPSREEGRQRPRLTPGGGGRG